MGVNWCPDEEGTREVVCANCPWSGLECELEDISDYFEHVEPGGEVPAGECPECGCLAYLSDAENETDDD